MSDHAHNPLTAGGGCIFVGVRVRPLGEGRGGASDRGLIKVDAARGTISIEPSRVSLAAGTKVAVAAAMRPVEVCRGFYVSLFSSHLA